VRQVVGNLLANAVRHTPQDAAVHVRIEQQPADSAQPQRPGWAVVEVTDEGPGLTPADAARVFERFYRADSARTRDLGGTGLGLAIVDTLVRAHGGRVDVVTAPGEGATFRVTLPAAARPAQTPQAAPA
jgi:signal transduction histidine kinase